MARRSVRSLRLRSASRARLALATVASSALALALSACGDSGPQFVPPPPAEIGAARITWTIETPAGAPLSCMDVGLESAEVLLGGAPKIVPCGDPQEAKFENLTAGRYAAIVRLRKLGSAVFAEQATNVDVVGGRTTTATITFSYDPVVGTKGALRVRWTIDGEDAATACAHAGAATVHIEDLPGSRDSLSADVACTTGEHSFEDIPSGRYSTLLLLRAASGQTINTASLLDVEVTAREVASVSANFHTGSVELASFLAEWTVNGTDAATGCAAAGTDVVLVKAVPQPSGMVATITATVACSAGRFFSDQVPPGTRPHRVVFQAFRNFATFPEIATSTIVENVLFVRGQTSTVSVNLTVP